MIEGLERFVTELRREGLASSPAEWLDAMRAVERLGVADRERFRLALRCTLAKRHHQQPVFDRVFARFFVPPARGRAGRDGRRRGLEGAKGHRPQRLDPQELKRRLSQARLGDPERRGRLRRVVLGPSAPPEARRARRRTEERPQTLTAERTARVHRDLARSLSVDDEREIAAQVPRLIERIRLRSGRRLRKASHGRLYPRRVFRENLRHGGVPFVLPRRRIRPRRARVVLLIDVSWSTARAAGLFLAMAFEFLRRAGDTKVLFFVDRAVDATELAADWLRGRTGLDRAASGASRRGPAAGIARGGVDFARLLQHVPDLNLNAPSDYGRAFGTLLRSRSRPRGRNTVLLVLGDGRTNRFDPQDWAFEEIGERCGAVLWLVPEPLARWGTGDSALGAYLAHVDTAVEARNLAGLARGVEELLRRL